MSQPHPSARAYIFHALALVVHCGASSSTTTAAPIPRSCWARLSRTLLLTVVCNGLLKHTGVWSPLASFTQPHMHGRITSTGSLPLFLFFFLFPALPQIVSSSGSRLCASALSVKLFSSLHHSFASPSWTPVFVACSLDIDRGDVFVEVQEPGHARRRLPRFLARCPDCCRRAHSRCEGRLGRERKPVVA